MGWVEHGPEGIWSTTLSTAREAMRQAGLGPPPDEFASLWQLDCRVTPAMDAAERTQRLAGWRHAVARTLSSWRGGVATAP